MLEKKNVVVAVIVSIVSCQNQLHVYGKAGPYLGVDVAILTGPPADVHLVLRGLLVDGVVKVDGVCVLLSPVSQHQHRTKNSQTNDHYGDRGGGYTS